MDQNGSVRFLKEVSYTIQDIYLIKNYCKNSNIIKKY